MVEKILIYDIETATPTDVPDGSKDILKFFGCYSYITEKYYFLTDIEKIKDVINKHDTLVGFNNFEYDNQVLYNNGFKELMYKNDNFNEFGFNYKINIDLMQIFKKRSSYMKIKSGMLVDLLMSYSLKYISKTIGVVDDDTNKIDNFDYKIFNKNSWTEVELNTIIEYLKRDVEVTKKMYDWIEKFFDGFKDFLSESDIKKKRYITTSYASFSYAAICRKLNLSEEYNHGVVGEKYGGGYVSYPAGEEFHGNIYCIDFNCLTEDTQIKMWNGINSDKYRCHKNKNISEVKPGDFIINQDGKQEVGAINKRKYNGNIIKIELDNGSILKCTPDHKFPILRDGHELIVSAEELIETDNMISPHTKIDKNNGNYKGKIPKICQVCGFEYSVFPSQRHIKTCCRECANILRIVNSKKINLGRTKDNCEYLRKMSEDRKDKKRSKKICENISIGTKKAMNDKYLRYKFEEGNKNKDISVFSSIGFHIKRHLTQCKNVKNGKFKYKDINMRSNWEVILAKNLDKNNVEWKYEDKPFKLSNGQIYWPDFYLPQLDKYIEVKGYLSDYSRKKINLFIKEHHDLIFLDNLNIIKDEEIKWLK